MNKISIIFSCLCFIYVIAVSIKSLKYFLSIYNKKIILYNKEIRVKNRKLINIYKNLNVNQIRCNITDSNDYCDSKRINQSVGYALLVFLDINDKPINEIRLKDDMVKIGRSCENDIVINDSTVSRKHCIILRNANSSFMIYDRNSLNHTKLNGEAIEYASLKYGSTIELGNIKLRFEDILTLHQESTNNNISSVNSNV